MSSKSSLRYKRKSGAITSLPLLALCVPAIVFTIIFHYIPIFGVVLAFKDYNYIDGILGSPWVGFENFEFFFSSNDAVRVIFNTVAYNVVLMFMEILFGIIFALLMYEINSKGTYFNVPLLLISYIRSANITPNNISININTTL